MNKQTFEKNSSFFFSSSGRSGSLPSIIFRTLFKIRYKTRNPYLITLKFGTDKQHIKGNSQTKFCMNLINFQAVINNYPHEKIKMFC